MKIPEQRTKEFATLVAENLENEGRGEVEVYDDYSGRGMYGKKTVGFVLSGDNTQTDLIRCLIETAVVEFYHDWAVNRGLKPDCCTQIDMLDFIQGISHLLPRRRDGMGLSMIYY